MPRFSPRASVLAAAALIFGAAAAAPAAFAQKGGKPDPKPAAIKPTLSTDEVAAKLTGVPVFLIVDSKGEPLVATPPSGGKPVVGVFLARREAANFYDGIKKRDKKMGEKLQIGALSLADVYRAGEKNRNVQFAFVPEEAQLKAARNMKGLDGKVPDQFDGAPVFVARTKGDPKDPEAAGYLTMEQNGRTIIPFFFEKSSLDALVATLFRTQPDVAKQLFLEAVSLDSVINMLRLSDSPQIGQVELIPLKAAVEFVKSQSNGPVGPQPPPADPKKGKKP
jgi:nickel transport protein